MKSRKKSTLSSRFKLESTTDDFPTLDDFKTYIDEKLKDSIDRFRTCHSGYGIVKIKPVPNLVSELSHSNAGLGLPWAKLARSLRSESEKNSVFLIEDTGHSIVFSLWFENAELAICLPRSAVDLG
jgi:hypothetical protein